MGEIDIEMRNIIGKFLHFGRKDEEVVKKMGMIREHFTFTGRVQGVGFRFRTGNLAKRYGVTGWVQNNYDGSVEAEMQGREEELDKIIQSLQQDSYIRIDWMTRNRIEIEPGEKRFYVRY
ncbi:hypothetical protein C806_03203 [Lachnospiraceae bacterium 3-1]|nr:hypothetical protein C806_03203 [Lachnospiraceae bacterium 3-1]